MKKNSVSKKSLKQKKTSIKQKKTRNGKRRYRKTKKQVGGVSSLKTAIYNLDIDEVNRSLKDVESTNID